MRESAAAWGVALSLIPELDTMVEAAIAQSEQDGHAVSVSVKDPDQQDALIASWQQSRAFRAFFGDEAAASATTGAAASEKEEGSPKVNERLATAQSTRSELSQPPAPLAGTDWPPAKTDSPPPKRTSFLTSPPLHDGSLTGSLNMFDGMDHGLGLPFSVSDLVVKDAERSSDGFSQTLGSLGFAPGETLEDFVAMSSNPEPIREGASEEDPSLGSEMDQKAYYELLMGKSFFP
ncbi:hypothetical protein MCOR25_002811 [Pyricularia grisea]|nr:hypothetical protein MCOR25_002811 [Pyricularia grisea]